MVSVERVLQYSDLAPEASLVSTEKQAPSDEWPQEGGIWFTAAHLRYSENLPFILKDLSFKIYPKEKVLQYLIQLHYLLLISL